MALRRGRRLALLALLSAAVPAGAQHQHEAAQAQQGDAPQGHDHHGGLEWTAGAWRLGLHGFANLAFTSEGGPRGDEMLYTSNMFGGTARRAVGGGEIGFGAMLSLEPIIGAEGYPLLLQTGETADGVNNLFDRQHPHDLFMELSVSARAPLGEGASVSLSAALPGEPALGPTAFVHRASASTLPIAPIGHHWMDSTHVAFGVVTLGVAAGPILVEGSWFNGKEPDQRRWGFDDPRLDSWSARVTARLGASLSLQAGAGRLKQPEFGHPGIDVTRYTASLTHGATLGSGLRLDTTLAWGSNRRSADITTSSFQRFPPARRGDAWLLESHAAWNARHHLAVRVERADKDELFPLQHPFHGRVFPATRASVSYLVAGAGPLPQSVGLGAVATLIFLPEELSLFYGERANSLLGFVRVALP